MIEMGKEYRTRDGSPVRLYTVQGANASQPIVGERFVYADVWHTSTWDTHGRWDNDGTKHRFDLVEVTPVRVFDAWVNVDEAGVTGLFTSRGTADKFAGNNRIACIHIRKEYKEGDGLSC